ncbi:MAG: DinB family protein [Vicinamibacteraceae bacterium]
MSQDALAGLLALLDEAYDRRSWHGTNLHGAVRAIEPHQVTWRPGPGRHNVWELVVHAAYWKYVVRKRVSGAPRGGFPLAGTNFYARVGLFNAERWQADVELLTDQHRQLRSAVAVLDETGLNRIAGGKPLAWSIRGAAAHDLYHAGQIQLLKTLAPLPRRAPTRKGTPR